MNIQLYLVITMEHQKSSVDEIVKKNLMYYLILIGREQSN